MKEIIPVETHRLRPRRAQENGDPAVALGTLATAAFILQLHDRLANLAAPATDALALSLDARRLPKRIRRAKS